MTRPVWRSAAVWTSGRPVVCPGSSLRDVQCFRRRDRVTATVSTGPVRRGQSQNGSLLERLTGPALPVAFGIYDCSSTLSNNSPASALPPASYRAVTCNVRGNCNSSNGRCMPLQKSVFTSAKPPCRSFLSSTAILST